MNEVHVTPGAADAPEHPSIQQSIEIDDLAARIEALEENRLQISGARSSAA